MLRMNFPARKNRRREEAKMRQIARAISTHPARTLENAQRSNPHITEDDVRNFLSQEPK